MITSTIKKEFEKAISRRWDKIYVFVDFHEVIMKPDYQKTDPTIKYYPFARELLQHLSRRKDICLIAWTCSHPKQILGYYLEFAKDGITFDYSNENPEVKTGDNRYGCYDQKPYYNILLDDKSGVQPEELEMILEEFKKYDLSEFAGMK